MHDWWKKQSDRFARSSPQRFDYILYYVLNTFCNKTLLKINCEAFTFFFHLHPPLPPNLVKRSGSISLPASAFFLGSTFRSTTNKPKKERERETVWRVKRERERIHCCRNSRRHPGRPLRWSADRNRRYCSGLLAKTPWTPVCNGCPASACYALPSPLWSTCTE